MMLNPQSNMDIQAVEQIQLQDSDFNASPQEGETISQGETVEVFNTEVGETSVLASYDALQLGGDTGANPKSGRGKMFINLKDTNGNEVSDRVEFRFVARPKNQNARRPLTPFFTLRDLDQNDPELRQALPPVTDGQNRPTVVSDGRIIGVEIRTSATSAEVSLSNSVVEVPAIAGY